MTVGDYKSLSLTELIDLRRKLPPPPQGSTRASLADRFIVPPFSVLDARQGYWQKRKRMWLELGIQSELGRGENELGLSDQARGDSLNHYRNNAAPGGAALPLVKGSNGYEGRGNVFKAEDYGSQRRYAKAYNIGMQANKDNNWQVEDNQGSGTSIFDPVLCELAYRWFCPPGGIVLDPFAGGSVRGIVAWKLGRGYSGVELRPEQAEANYAQAEVIFAEETADVLIEWKVGDALDVKELCPGLYDMVFSCPPYFDLERYSDDPRDLSNMDYPTFLRVYRNIIAQSCSMLRDNRFAVWVVGDVRDRDTGNYRNFVGDTVEAFRMAGLHYYNEAVLLTAVGSLPIRVGKQFTGYRKLGKTHQNVLVFLKGDAGAATRACGQVDVDDIAMPALVPGCVAVCEDGVEAYAIERPLVEACLLADIGRGEARANGLPVPRVWIASEDGWVRVEDDTELTYVVGDKAYLSRYIFPDAARPADAPPPPRILR